MENASDGAEKNGHGRFAGIFNGPENVGGLGRRNGLWRGNGLGKGNGLGSGNGLGGGRGLGMGRGGIGGGSGLGLLLLEHWPLIHLSLLAQSSLIKHLYSRQPPSMQFGLDLGQFLERWHCWTHELKK